jgi:hypothetical protein
MNPASRHTKAADRGKNKRRTYSFAFMNYYFIDALLSLRANPEGSKRNPRVPRCPLHSLVRCGIDANDFFKNEGQNPGVQPVHLDPATICSRPGESAERRGQSGPDRLEHNFEITEGVVH